MNHKSIINLYICIYIQNKNGRERTQKKGC